MIKLVLSNIFRKKKDTILTGTILGIAVFTLVLIGCTYYQVHEGIKLTNDRLGADVIILPRTDKIDYSSALYTAEPSEEYIYLSNLEFLHGDYKIEDKTYQFFTHTIKAGCCTVTEEARVVGFDQATDFIIKPWLEMQEFDILADDEIIIGGDITSVIGQRMSILGKTYKIVGTLYFTGSGLDQSIFMDIEEARRLTENSFFQNDVDKKVSSVLLRMKEGVNIDDYVQNFNMNNPELTAISKSEALSYVKNQLLGWGQIVGILIVAMSIILIIALFNRYTAIIQNRKRELGYLISLGMSRKEICISIVGEISILVILYGGIAGGTALLCIKPLVNRLKDFFDFPISVIGINEYIFALSLGIGFAFVVSIMACILPLIRILKQDPQELFSIYNG
ncbi:MULTISPECIES: ABC transporter permease [Lachnospiraceae]|jgi:putative ABC transport system permease protein|uniref:ABC transporter permease n=1 Tax=Mediterraneibacter gnavus TaxID=33038 RepID=A0A414SED6_MEDGN|nr:MULTISPECIES: ABC transporter permease [Lachnospiraceae]RHG17495.1 ABC transporter permease [Mediterraneibacter gnavus]UOX53384.1 ABC transporter permease [Dorea longicatena]